MSIDNDWSRVFLDTQKHYWDSWFDWAGSAAEASGGTTAGKAGAGKGGFPPGMDEWFSLVSKSLAGDGADFYRKTFEAGRGFFDIGQVFWNLTRDLQSAGDNWKSALDENMNALKQAMTQDSSSVTDAWSAYAGNWGLNSGAWADFMKSLGQQPVDASDLMGVNAAEAWQRLFKVPAMGYNRETQEGMQQWALLAGENVQAMQAYAALLNETNAEAVDLMSRKLAEQIPAGEAPSTLRGLYDLWVDSGEQAYNRLTSEARFAKAQGQLMNSAMRLKKHENDMTQDMLGMLNIPNRREMDTALCRLHDVRAEVRDLEDRLDAAEVESLHKQLSELRDTVRILTEQQAALAGANDKLTADLAGLATGAAPKPATRKTSTARKTTTARKTATRAGTAKTSAAGPKSSQAKED